MTTDILIEKWKNLIAFTSSTNQMVDTPIFKAIEQKEDAVEALINSLRKEANIGVMVGLAVITKQMPVPPEDRGFVEKMRMHWLNWYDEKRLDKEAE